MSSATPAAPCRHAGIVQDRKNLLWSYPTLHIDFFGRNPSRRLRYGLPFTSAGAKFAVPMRRDLNPDNRRPQVGYVAKKLHRTLFISVFHLAIRRTHPTKRLNSALNALCHSCALARSQSQKGLFPHWP